MDSRPATLLGLRRAVFVALATVLATTGPIFASTALAYDDADRPTAIVHSQNGSPLLSLGYSYDAAGNVATYTDDAGTATFGYDDLNRLTSADDPGTTNDVTYGYDADGNLVELARAGEPPLTRTYDDADRLVSEDDGLSARTLTYDDNGSLLDDGAGRTFSYDSFGRLTGVDATGLAVDYTLDGYGNRLAATVNGSTTSYDLDYLGLATVLSDGTHRFLPGVPADGYEQGGSWFGGLTNAQGTVLGHADATGLVGSLRHYDAWGQPLGGAAPVGPSYTGEWTDESGLVNLRFRAYDPSLQRFVGRDSFPGAAAVPATWNRFAYANGNPLTFTDPSGHFGVARLAFSFGLQSVYGIGDLYSGLTGFFSTDWIAGYELADGERMLAMGTALPGPALYMLNRLRHVVQHRIEAARSSRLAARAGDLAGFFRKSSISDEAGFAARGSVGGLPELAARGAASSRRSAAISDLTRTRTRLRSAIHTPYQVHIDPILRKGPMAIDTSVFASGATTAAGGVRNSRAFWRSWRETYGDTLSAANRTFLDEGLSPIVDDVWLRTFPEHQDHLGETLVHHHLGRGPMAIPLPQPVHGNIPGFGIWHSG